MPPVGMPGFAAVYSVAERYRTISQTRYNASGM